LFWVAIAGAALARTVEIWSTLVQRDREEELLTVGNEIRRAIENYYLNSPGTKKQFPPKLEDLLKDPRQLQIKRYLRKLYLDPITGKPEWGTVSAAGGITGVFSLSTHEPIKKSGFSAANATFENAKRHRDWRFVYVPVAATPPTNPKPALLGGGKVTTVQDQQK
jgi:type II secretory pathway pseudopilin PulG